MEHNLIVCYSEKSGVTVRLKKAVSADKRNFIGVKWISNYMTKSIIPFVVEKSQHDVLQLLKKEVSKIILNHSNFIKTNWYDLSNGNNKSRYSNRKRPKPYCTSITMIRYLDTLERKKCLIRSDKIIIGLKCTKK